MLEVLRSGQLSLGPRLGGLRAAVSPAFVGARQRAPSRSGTAGLHLALRAVGVHEGDEVMTSPFSFVASANAVLFERARPVFADIDPVTLNLDPASAEAAITSGRRRFFRFTSSAIPRDMEAFEDIARRHGLALVEDACEALGPSTGTGWRSAPEGTRRCLGSTPTSSSRRGRGG